MLRLWALAPVLGAALLAGCLDETPGVASFLLLESPGPEVPANWDASCDGACEFSLSLPESMARLDVAVYWDPTITPGFSLEAEAPHGGRWQAPGTDSSATARVEPAPAGQYTLHVVGSGPFSGTAAASAGAGDLLPNLVTLIPSDVGVGPCSSFEQAEQGAQRCLRLSNAVGNIGHGPLEVRLAPADGALSVAAGGAFVQRIYDASGSYREHVVAGAEFHLTHRHFHYAGLAGFQLHAFNETTGLRGDAVGETKKSGFCFIDTDRIRNTSVAPAPHAYAYQGCWVPLGTAADGMLELGWHMGVSVGWYDLYDAWLDEQYVDIAGVPDGVYELVSVADVGETLEESAEWDNTASVVLRLTGDDVEILQERGTYER